MLERKEVCTLEFEPRDLWIGIYWDINHSKEHTTYGFRYLHIYICIIPCFPLHIRILIG